MVLLLIRDVSKHPGQLLFAEADDAKAALPLKSLHAELLVDLVRAGAFKLADQFADTNLGLNAESHVNVGWCSSDAVQIHTFYLAAAVFEEFIDLRFERRRDQGPAIFGMPVQVQKDFMKDMAGHGAISQEAEVRSLLKQAEESFL